MGIQARDKAIEAIRDGAIEGAIELAKYSETWFIAGAASLAVFNAWWIDTFESEDDGWDIMRM